MKGLTQLRNVLNSKENQQRNAVNTLYLVMEKVGGYEQLMNLGMPTLMEIVKSMEWETKEQNKSMQGKK